jgi:hypothetical protein
MIRALLLTAQGAFKKMFCLWVQINPRADRSEFLQLPEESGTVCIIFGFIHDVMASAY